MEKQAKGKILILILLLCSNPSFMNAQAFQKGDNTISVGYGFAVLDVRNDDISFWEVIKYQNETGPFYLKYESALTTRMSMSININYGYFSQNGIAYIFEVNNISGPATFNNYFSVFSILARINWHYGDSNKFDPYWGFGFGYKSLTQGNRINDPAYSNYNSSETSASVTAEITIGLRYYLNNKLAIYAETGISQSALQLGLTYKLK